LWQLRISSGIESAMVPPHSCPVCRSEKLTPIKHDGTLAYRCANGHVFVVRENNEPKAKVPK